jgi:hypothetical protein
MKKDMRHDWMRSYWRPMMAIVYMIVILFDFIIAPSLWSIVQIVGMGVVSQQWVPLTLGSGGLFHVAMGAVLGISAYTRGQEKLEKLRNRYEEGDENVNLKDDTYYDGK